MCDPKKCDSLSDGLRTRAANILGDFCISTDGKKYADIQRPSYAWRNKSSKPAKSISRKPVKKILFR